MEKQMKTLIIAAHGSRKQASNIEVERLAGRLAGKLSDRFDRVIPAFLQFADPLLEDVLQTAAKDGGQVVVFPFFIGSGSHILEDIPALVSQAGLDHPEVEFILARHLGKLESIDRIIIDEVTGSGTSHN